MIQMQTLLDVADNSGAKVARCIKVLGGTGRRFAGLGDVVVLSVQKTIPGGQIKKGTVVRGVIVRCRKLQFLLDHFQRTLLGSLEMVKKKLKSNVYVFQLSVFCVDSPYP